jgi:LmeA-like phospholipid-binding
MELLTVLLSGLLTSLTFGGIIADKATEQAISSRLSKVENIQVRIDNAPSLQILNGKADKIRIAATGLWLTPELRIDGFQMETDPVEVNPQSIQQDMNNLRLEALPKPFQAGIKIAVKEQDINNALSSTAVINRIQAIVSNAISTFGGSAGITYKVENPQVRFLPNNRLGLKVSLSDSSAPKEKLDLDMETGVKIIGGRKIQLVDARGTVNKIPLPRFILDGIVNRVNEQSDLAILEKTGLTARILDVKVVDKRMEMATFVRFQLPERQKPM